MKATKENIYPILTNEWLTAEQIKDKLKLQESVKSVGKYIANMMAADQTVECKKIHNVRHYRLKTKPTINRKKVSVAIQESKTLFNEFVGLMKDAMEYRALKEELKKWKGSMSSKGIGMIP